VEDKKQQQAMMLANRLQKRFRHLKKWAQRKNIGAFRLYDRDIPEIPLVLDFYGEVSGAEPALCGALYKRPYEKDEADEESWLCAMKESASSALGIDSKRIFLKQRRKQKGVFQYEKTSHERFEKIVSEGELSFKVNLSDYLDTGLFIDRRLLRAIVKNEAAGKRVLNLFSYTGSFSVYAAAGKSVSTDSVDISNSYLNMARENFSLNGMSASLLQQWDYFDRSVHSANKLIRADALLFVDKAIAEKIKWDIIVLDPPVFSNSKKMTDNFDLNRDIARLLGKCLKLLAPCGKIFLSVNMRRSPPAAEELEAQLRAYTYAENASVTDLESSIIDEDFKGKKIPKAFSVKL